MFPDQFLFELSCKNTHTHGNTDRNTHRDAHTQTLTSRAYSTGAFCKNETITNNSQTLRVMTPSGLGIICTKLL